MRAVPPISGSSRRSCLEVVVNQRPNRHHLWMVASALLIAAGMVAALFAAGLVAGCVRYDMVSGIVRRIESKLVLPPDRPSAEKLLEEIARERRSNAGYR